MHDGDDDKANDDGYDDAAAAADDDDDDDGIRDVSRNVDNGDNDYRHGHALCGFRA